MLDTGFATMNHEPTCQEPNAKLRTNCNCQNSFLAQSLSLQAPELQMPDILLVEDKDSLRRVLRLTLENAGYSVTEAADARAGTKCNLRSPA